jgi:cytochrome c556
MSATMFAAPFAAAQKDPNVRAVEYRQAVLTVLGNNFGPLVAMARGNIPYDAETVKLRARRMHVMTNMMEESFRRDTSEADLETEALDKIWDNWDDFMSKIEDVQQATLAMADAPGNMDAFKAAFNEVGGACKSCHDNYRED